MKQLIVVGSYFFFFFIKKTPNLLGTAVLKPRQGNPMVCDTSMYRQTVVYDLLAPCSP